MSFKKGDKVQYNSDEPCDGITKGDIGILAKDLSCALFQRKDGIYIKCSCDESWIPYPSEITWETLKKGDVLVDALDIHLPVIERLGEIIFYLNTRINLLSYDLIKNLQENCTILQPTSPKPKTKVTRAEIAAWKGVEVEEVEIENI